MCVRCECGKFCAAGESACSSCAKAGHSSIEPALIDTVLPAHVGPTVSKKCVRLPSHYAAVHCLHWHHVGPFRQLFAVAQMRLRRLLCQRRGDVLGVREGLLLDVEP